MADVRHFYFNATNSTGDVMRMVVSIDVDEVARRLVPRVRANKSGRARAMHGAITAERMLNEQGEKHAD